MKISIYNRKLPQRALAAALTLVMAIGLMPGMRITADAATTTTYVDSWDELSSAVVSAVSATTGTTIKLTGHCEADSDDTYIEVVSGTPVTIDLNGYNINRNLTSATEDGYVIKNSGTLTITDYASDSEGRVTGGYNSGKGGGVYNTGDLTLSGGEIRTNRSGGGGGVYNGGTFYMYGGSIVSNSCGSDNGGGVLNYMGCTFCMAGGTISGNTALYSGGVENTAGTFILKGGSITGNTASFDGGGVYNTSRAATFTMEGGNISGNTAGYYGGGVVNKAGTFTLSIGTISENKAENSYGTNELDQEVIGGGVCVIDGGTFDLCGSTTSVVSTGAVITGNSATDGGGGVYVEAGSTLNVSGKVCVSENTSGSGVVADNLCLGQDVVANIAGQIRVGSSIGINYEGSKPYEFTSAVEDRISEAQVSLAKYQKYFVSDEDGYVIRITDNKKLQIELHEHEFTYTVLDNTITATCDEDCTEGYGTGITLTLNASEPTTYDGTAREAAITGYPYETVENLAAAPTEINYYTGIPVLYEEEPQTQERTADYDGEGFTVSMANRSTSTEDGTSTSTADTVYTATGDGMELVISESLDGAPTDAGYYIATFEWGGVTAGIGFVIKSATPEITTAPTATSITVGDTLSESILTGGAAEVDGTVVRGTFSWKTPDVKPSLSDSGATKYTVVFTPDDTTNYAKVTCEVKLTVKSSTSDLDSSGGGTIGTTYSVSGNKYKVTGSSSVSFAGTSASGSVTIPATVTINGKTYKVTAVAASALAGNTKVTKVVIGPNVTKIGNKAFAKCTALKKVVVGKKVKKIGKKAFLKCKALKNIKIKTAKLKLKTVGAKAFKGINAKAVVKVPKARKKLYKKILRKRGAGSKVTVK